MKETARDNIAPQLVTVWNASLGGGNRERFATRFHGRDLAFRARSDDPRDCIRWVAEGHDLGVEPASLGRALRGQAIYSRAYLHVRGLLTVCDVITLGGTESAEGFERAAAHAEGLLAVAAPAAAWCPAEIQLADLTPEPAIAVNGADHVIVSRLADDFGAEHVVAVGELRFDTPSSRARGLRIESHETIEARDRFGGILDERRAVASIGLARLRPWLEQRNYQPEAVSDGFVHVPNPDGRAL